MGRPIRSQYLALGTAALAILTVARALARSESANGLPRPDHIVVVIRENHSYSDVIGNPGAPYINSLRGRGANFTSSHGVRHPDADPPQCPAAVGSF